VVNGTAQYADAGAIIKSERERRGYSLDITSALTGIRKGYLSRVENGHQSISVCHLIALARGLDICIEDLLKGYVEHAPMPSFDEPKVMPCFASLTKLEMEAGLAKIRARKHKANRRGRVRA